RIGREHVRGTAECVARELVEQDHQRECAFGLAGPVVERARCGLQMQRHETLAEARVESLVLAEPGLGAGVAPEAGDVQYRVALSHRDGNRCPVAAVSIPPLPPHAPRSAGASHGTTRTRTAEGANRVAPSDAPA